MKKTLSKSLIKHRLFLKNKILLNSLNFKFYLICHFNKLTGLGFKMLKLALTNMKIKFNFNILNNMIKFKSNQLLIGLTFKNYFEYKNLIKILKISSIIPFICYPLFILNKSKNILFPIKFFNIKKFNRKQLIKQILINLVKKNFLNFFLRLNYIYNANINSISFKKK